MAFLLAKRVVPYSVSTVTGNQCRSSVLNRGRWASIGAGNHGAVDAMDKKKLVRARAKRSEAAARASQKHGGNGRDTKTGSRSSNLAIAAIVALVGGTSCYLMRKELRELYDGSFVEKAANSILHTAIPFTKKFTDPNSDKLLQDWSPGFMHPDQPCPPTLVLDLDHTLVAPVYKAGKGWLVAKRPGVHEFLKKLSKYYEIVVFTSRPNGGTADLVITSLDRDQCVWYRLFREATLFENGLYIKDLSKLNRPIERIVILDDEPECFGLQPDNGIAVKPYIIEEGTDPHLDNTLESILPFLVALAIEVQDFRPIIRRYKGMTADEIGREYNQKVADAKARSVEEQSKGLGGVLRRFGGGTIGETQETSGKSSSSNSLIGDVLQNNTAGVGGYSIEAEGKSGASAESRALFGAKPMVPGPPPPKEDEVGGLLRRYREKNKEDEELYRKKIEKWNEVMAKKTEQAAQKLKA